MRKKRIAAVALVAGVIGLTTLVAAPAQALDPMTYTVNCSVSGPDVYSDVHIYAGQDAIFSFSPSTCTQAYWSMLNPALADNTSLTGTGSVTIAAADVVCDSEFEIVLADSSTYEYITLTGCEDAPAAAPLPDTGIDANQAGLLASGAAVLALAGVALAGLGVKANRHRKA